MGKGFETFCVTIKCDSIIFFAIMFDMGLTKVGESQSRCYVHVNGIRTVNLSRHEMVIPKLKQNGNNKIS